MEQPALAVGAIVTDEHSALILNCIVMQDAFERYIVSGLLLMKGAHANQHHVRLASVLRQGQDIAGRMSTVPLQGCLSSLDCGQSLQREWVCSKDGFHKIFSMDCWRHTELICKLDSGQLLIQDCISWHDSRSVAHREYTVQTIQDRMAIQMGEWHINLAGLTWPVRNHIEKVLRRELPKAADRSIKDFYESRAIGP